MKSTARLLLLLALVLSTVAVLTSCKRERAQTAYAGAPVILISIDTLRADRLPAYGYKGVETPHLDALRRDSILFANAYSHCPMTLPSHVSMLTGLLPTEHEVRNNLGYRFDASKHTTLPQLLKQSGYATGAAVSSYVLRADTGIGPAFDFYDDAIPVATAGAASQHQRSGTATREAAQRWIGQLPPAQPFFFMFHLYEPHAPYTPPEPFRARYGAQPYDGEVAASDAITGEFLSFLKQSGIYDRALIIVTSDHGEGLWDHGEDQHGILLYREVLQVPLFVKLPGSARGGSTIQAPAALVDLFPIVTSLVGATTPANVKGLSLAALEDAKTPQRRIYSETFYPRIHLGWSELRSLIDGRHHYIQAPRPELYDVVADPRETKDILTTDRRAAASLRDELAAYPSGIQQLQSIDPEDAAKLAALGYVGSAQNASGPLPNPRDMLPYLERIKSGFKLADERRYGEAVAVMRKLVAENPGLFDVWDKLGEVLVEMGEYDEAIRVYREAMQRSQRFSPEMALSLGEAYLKAKQPGEAERHARLAEKGLPAGSHGLLARVALSRRDFAAADREAALAIGTQNPQPATMLLRAEVRRAAGDLPGALAALDAAAQRANELHVPSLHRLDFLRGDVLARMGRVPEAVEAYRREIEHFPHNTQAYANLAIIYFIEGDSAAVERLLEAMVAANPHPGAYALAAHTLETLEDRAGAERWRRRRPGTR